MNTYKVKKGYNLPIQGAARATIENAPAPKTAGVHPAEFGGLKPKLLVQEGDSVKIGTPLFLDKKRTNIVFCSPAAGKVQQIQFGHRRVVEAIRIAVGEDEFEQHPSYRPDEIAGVGRDELISLLLKAGVWPFLRQRPFNRVANPQAKPSSIFVNCMDTAPLANDPEFALDGKASEFQAGLEALRVLAGSGKVHVVVDGGLSDSMFTGNSGGIQEHGFTGKHPAGLVGTHISRIDPLNHHKVVWHISAHDTVRLGQFLLVGQYPTELVIAAAGTGLKEGKRRYLRTKVGACIADILGDALIEKEHRIISGNVLSGRRIGPDDYIGFYDNLISVIPEGNHNRFIGWLLPGAKRPSFTRAYISSFIPGQIFNMDTNLNGEERALVKTGDYERVVALDVLPDFLIKAILSEDVELMEQLGILECEPEDFALCTYICPSKTEFTEILREGLELMEREMG